MKCPTCRTRLASQERLGVQIDVCAKCRGVWLDRDELDKILEHHELFEMTLPSRLDPQRGRRGVPRRTLRELFDDDDHWGEDEADVLPDRI